jgi:RimJ/RimL family protein N-acetyltransferase
MIGPELKVDGYMLRPPVLADLDGIHALTQSDAMNQFLGGQPPTMSSSFERLQRSVGGWTLHGYGVFMVRETGSDTIIGNCGIFHSWRGLGEDFDNQPEAGWIIAESHWGKGLAQQFMRAVLSWFDATHGPRRIVAMIEPGHGASERVAAQLGFAPYRTREFYAVREMALYERIV